MSSAPGNKPSSPLNGEGMSFTEWLNAMVFASGSVHAMSFKSITAFIDDWEQGVDPAEVRNSYIRIYDSDWNLWILCIHANDRRP